MGIRDWFRSTPVQEARTTTAPAAPDAVKRQGYEPIPPSGLTPTNQSVGTDVDRRTNLQMLHDTYVGCTWSWACVNAIARTITAGGLMVDWDGNDGEGDQEPPAKPASVLALERLIKYVNPREDILQLLRSTVTDLEVYGDAFLEVVWWSNVPVALYTLDAISMQVLADDHGQITGYRQKMDTGQEADFEPREVIHISLDSPRSAIFGQSPTEAASLPITTWLFAAATVKETMRKGNPPQIHVDHPAAMSIPDSDRWNDQYMARNVGPRNIGKPITTKGGATVKELGHHNIQQYLHILDQKRDEIIATYGVPPAEVGIIESGNLGGGTGESQRRTFVANVCRPVAALIMEKLQFHLAAEGFGVEGWHLKFRELDMRDSKTIEDIYDTRLRNGSWTLDRYRAEIGEPPAEGGDQPVLVDRQNIVMWRDMDAKSKAGIAKDLKGSEIEVSEPKDGEPVGLEKPEPEPVPDALAPFAGQANPPEDDEQPPPPGGKGDDDKQDGKAKTETYHYAGRVLREDYRRYRRRRSEIAALMAEEVDRDAEPAPA